MAVATWRVLAFGTLLGAVALPASAQVVIGGSGRPSVEVNWAVLDSLGRQPTLADMLRGEAPAEPQVAPGKTVSAPQGVVQLQGIQFKPYQPPKVPAAKAKVSSPKKSSVTPVAAKAEPSPTAAALVQAAHKEAPAAPVMAEPAVTSAGPQVLLPEVPKPAAQAEPVTASAAESAPTPKPAEPVAESRPAQAIVASTPAEPAIAAKPAEPAVAVKPVEPAVVAEPVIVAKADPAPVPVSVTEVKAEVAAVAPTALTPPPLAAPAPQVVALPPVAAEMPVAVTSSPKGDTLSVVFGADSASLPALAQPELDKLVKRLRKEDSLGLQLLAFAEGDEANASKARRLSLSRALEVRKYLMDQGVRSTRIEVRALGNKLEGVGPADRVDAVLVSR